MNALEAHLEIGRCYEECRYEGRVISREDVARWLDVADDQVMCDLAYLLLGFETYRREFAFEADIDLLAVLIAYLIGTGTDGTSELSCCEVLRLLSGAFCYLWSAESRHLELLLKIKTHLGELASRTADSSNLVETVVLEHIFVRPDIQEFFSDWRDIPELRSAYDEGVALALLWRSNP